MAFRYFDFVKNRDAKFKMHVAKIVVGFAEGLRFRDIVLKICHSKPIQMKTDVDWNRRSKAGDPQVSVLKAK